MFRKAHRSYLLCTAAVLLLLTACVGSPEMQKDEAVENPSAAKPSSAKHFAAIDTAVAAMPPREKLSIPEVTAMLNEIASSPESVSADTGLKPGSDWAKTRALFAWITLNIDYDVDSFFGGSPALTDPQGVFTSGSTVCEGYAGLFEEIGRRLDLDVTKIHGYAKGYGYAEDSPDPGGTNHAWNAVVIDGSMHLFDPTWGAGHVGGATGMEYIEAYNEFWFDTPPEQFIFSHYPEESDYQKIADPVNRRQFFSLPNLSGRAFNAGVNPGDVRSLVKSGEYSGLPEFWGSADSAVLVEFPLTAVLEAGRTYRIEIETDIPFILVSHAPDVTQIMENNGSGFIVEGNYPPGELNIFVSPQDAVDPYAQSYDGFLGYTVE